MHHSTTPPRFRRRLAPFLPCAGLVASGCLGPLDSRDFLTLEPDSNTLHEIDRVRFEDQSRTEPVTVEEATKQVTEDRVGRLLHELREQAAAVPSIELTLEEVRGRALESNLDLQVQVLNPSIALTSVGEEEAKFEWTFDGSYRRNRVDAPTALATVANQVQSDSANLGLAIPLRTGGTVQVQFPFTETTTDNRFSTLNPSVDADLRFSISQPLLRNAGNRVNTHSIRVQKHQHQIADVQTKLEATRILAEADRAYWRLYAAQEELKVRQQQYELATNQLEQARRRVQAGEVAEIEIIRAQSGVAERLEAIIIADTTVKARRRDLKRIMNQDDLSMESETIFVLVSKPDPLGLDLDPLRLAAYALDNRMELLELEIQLAIDASTVDFQRNQKLPLITVDYTYNFNGLGRTHNQAFDQLLDHRFVDFTLGLTTQIPLGNEAAKARLHRAILQRVQRLATRRQREAAIRQEVYDAVDQLKQNWQRILAARTSAVLEGRTYEAEKRQFQVGARTSTDVLDAATRLADAQSAEIRALTDYQIAQIDLAFATGTLLGYGKVRWEAADVPDRN